MKNKILKYGLLTFLSLVYTFPAMGFPGSPESGENEEEMQEGAPIDHWELILFIAAIGIGFYFLTRRKTKITV
jgi:hypothetical protein